MNLFLSKKGLSSCFNLKLRCSLRFDADDDDDDDNSIDHGFHRGIGLGMRKGKGNPKAIIGNPALAAPLPLPIPPPPQPLQLLSVFDLDTATAPLSQTQIQTPQESSSRRGSPLGFPDRPLPDKVVVAVDVDEGMFFSLFANDILCASTFCKMILLSIYLGTKLSTQSVFLFSHFMTCI